MNAKMRGGQTKEKNTKKERKRELRNANEINKGENKRGFE